MAPPVVHRIAGIFNIKHLIHSNFRANTISVHYAYRVGLFQYLVCLVIKHIILIFSIGPTSVHSHFMEKLCGI